MREDGSLWLHLDDRELGTAKHVCDEVFGPGNAAGVVTWVKTRRPSYLHGQLASVTDHLLVYGRNRKELAPFTQGTTEPGKRVPISNRGNPIREVLFPVGTVRFNCADGLYQAGNHSSPGIEAALLSDVTVSTGRNITPLRMSLPSRYSPARLQQLIAGGADFVVAKEPFRPSYVSPGGSPKLISNLWSWQFDDAMETNEDAAKQQERLFPGRPFPYAKPEGLLHRIIEIASAPREVVLDCFAGSGTTAAVAQKLGRGWIAIEESDATARNYLHPRMAPFVNQ